MEAVEKYSFEQLGVAQLMALDDRFGSKAEVQRGLRNVRSWG
jgi:hypothetical protein